MAKKSFFDKFFHKDRTGKKIAVFALKTSITAIIMFLATTTFVLALIPRGESYVEYKPFSSFGGISATSTRLAVSGQAVSDDANTAFGVYGYSFSRSYASKESGGIVGDSVGLYGDARASNGYPTSGGNAYGVWGNARLDSDVKGNVTGVYGEIVDDDGFSKNAFGIRGEVYDETASAESNYFGVYGYYSGAAEGFGVYGEVSEDAIGSTAIYGRANENNFAGNFEGNVKISGDLMLDVVEAKDGSLCSVEGSIVYNMDMGEICFCNGANWMKVSATSTLCE